MLARSFVGVAVIEWLFEARSRNVNARRAVGDREQMGSGAAAVIWIGRSLPRTYLALSAQDRW